MSQQILAFEAAHVDTTLYVRDAQDCYEVASDAMIFTAARAAVERRYPARTPMGKPEVAADYLKNKLGGLEHEAFGVLFLNSQLELIAYREMFQGTLASASVYPREVAKAALNYNAAALIMAHNHPSGMAEPSEADKALTRQMKSALAMFDVRVLDHIIVGADATASLAEMGLV